MQKTKKEFIVIKKGPVYIIYKKEEIAFIYTSEKVTYIIDKEGKKNFCSENLNDLEKKLDNHFFRASRQYLINAQFIKSFRSQGAKIIVEVVSGECKSAIQISQPSVAKFKNWIYDI